MNFGTLRWSIQHIGAWQQNSSSDPTHGVGAENDSADLTTAGQRIHVIHKISEDGNTSAASNNHFKWFSEQSLWNKDTFLHSFTNINISLRCLYFYLFCQGIFLNMGLIHVVIHQEKNRCMSVTIQTETLHSAPQKMLLLHKCISSSVFLWFISSLYNSDDIRMYRPVWKMIKYVHKALQI